LEDDSSASSALIVSQLRKAGCPAEIPAGQLKQGYGGGPCFALNFLCDAALAKVGFRVRQPQFPDDQAVEEAIEEDPGEDEDEDVMDNEAIEDDDGFFSGLPPSGAQPRPDDKGKKKAGKAEAEAKKAKKPKSTSLFGDDDEDEEDEDALDSFGPSGKKGGAALDGIGKSLFGLGMRGAKGDAAAAAAQEQKPPQNLALSASSHFLLFSILDTSATPSTFRSIVSFLFRSVCV
jgi:hypothetical protein